MAFLDFMKNRPQWQQTAKPSPETPKQQPAQMKPENLPDAEKAKIRDAVALLNKATQHQLSPPAAGEGSNVILLQKQNNQDKVQAALSPTDNFNGKTALQTPAPTRSRGRGISR